MPEQEEFFKVSPLINLASKMDSRTSNEYLNVDPNSTSFEMVNLVNADLFNTKALSTRLGTQDLGGGVINTNGPTTILMDTTAVPSGTGGYNFWEFNFGAGTFYDYIGTIYIPSGNQNIYRGGITLRGDSGTMPSGTDNNFNDIIVTMNIYLLNQTNFPSSGIAFMSGTNANDHQLHSIAVSGNYNAPTFPQYSNYRNPQTYIPNDPIAMSTPVKVNLGAWYPGSGNNGFGTAPTTVNWEFDPPFMLNSGSVYFIEHWIQDAKVGLSSGRGYDVFSTHTYYAGPINPIIDLVPNALLAQEFLYYGSPANQQNAIRTIDAPNEKSWLSQQVLSYQSPSYMVFDNPTAYYSQNAPLISGNTTASFAPAGTISPNKSVNTHVSPTPQWDGTKNVPGPASWTNSAEFGQTIHLASGVNNIYGGYFYANTFSGGTYTSAQYSQDAVTAVNKLYTRTKQNVNPSGYNIGYTCNISSIDSFTGIQASGNYAITGRKIINSFSGNYVFNNPLANNVTIINSMSGGLEKISAIFDNPVQIDVTNPSGVDILLSFAITDPIQGGPLTDYNVVTDNIFQIFSSPLKIGMEWNKNVSGTYVFNYTGDNQHFIQANYDWSGGTEGQYYDLTCGLIDIPADNGITLVYDYSIGSSRNEKIILGQRDKLYSTTFGNPKARTQIFSGAQIGNELLWCATTYQNLFFASQYGNSGTQVCWDQIYSQPSGNWTQPWGLMPEWSMFPVSGIPVTPASVVEYSGAVFSGLSLGYGLASGNSVQVMLAVQMESGGYRASTKEFIASGNNVYIGFSGIDIFVPSGTDANSQYKFDVVPQATYLFVTQASNNGIAVSGLSPSGNGAPPTTSIFYLAEVLSAPSGLSRECINPLSNSGTFAGAFLDVSGNAYPNPGGNIYLGNFDSNTLTQQIPNILNYNQSYLDQQVPTPRFRQVVTFFDYVIGVGDPDYPSRLWYCGIGNNGGQPQIWGIDGNVAGYYEVMPDDGSPITGLAVFRDNLFVFKYGSIYRYTYTGNPSQPLQKYTMSNTLGNLGFFDTVSTDYGVFFLSQFGPAMVSLGPPDTIADEITPTYQQYDHTNLTFAVGIYDRIRQQILWNISSNVNSPSNQMGLVYNTAERAWTQRQGAMWNSAGIVFDYDNFNQLWVGTSNGQLQQIQTGNADNDTLFVDTTGNITTKNISLQAETPWLNFGNSENLKRLKSLKINCNTSAQVLRIDVYYDQNPDIIQYTRYLNMSNSVVQRVISLGGRPARTVKLVFTSVGNPDTVKINSMQFSWSDFGPSSQF